MEVVANPTVVVEAISKAEEAAGKHSKIEPPRVHDRHDS